MTIPKTYTLRQLRKLRGNKVNLNTIYVDLFLDSLEKQENEEKKGKKSSSLRIEPGRPFVYKK